MKTQTLLLISLVLLINACSGFQAFDKEESMVFQIGTPEQVVMGNQSWTGPADCSATAYLNKSNGGLLLTIEVKDDSVKTGNPQSYMNDGVELYFDLRPPRLRKNNFYEKGVFQAIILPEPGKKQVAPITWFPGYYETMVNGTKAYTQLRDSGYLVQVFLPYSALSRSHFWPRSIVHMDIAINDADTGNRESQIMWAGKADNWNNPVNFAPARLKETENKVKEPEPPNILLLLTDHQTLKAMSFQGNRYLRTPNMDALGEYGARFLNAYCSSPQGSSSRSSILTGKMPHTSGSIFEGSALDTSLASMGTIFSNAGYQTIWAGKWGLPDDYPHTGTQEKSGFRFLNFLPAEKMSARGDITDPPLADAAVKYLKGRRREPFLLVVSLQNPHDINALTTKPDAFPFPPNIESAPPLPSNHLVSRPEPELIEEIRDLDRFKQTFGFGDREWRNYLFHYYRMIERADREIGKIISQLEKEGLDENTIIILTSVQGDGAASHRWTSGLSLYQESLQVPLIITRFGSKEIIPEDILHPVSGIDILPTMMDYAGIEMQGLQGKSLKPIIENPDTSFRKYVVSQLFAFPDQIEKQGRMITDGRYKYILYSHGTRNEQLFDLVSDPGETRNLAYSASSIALKNKMKAALVVWMKEHEDNYDLSDR